MKLILPILFLLAAGAARADEIVNVQAVANFGAFDSASTILESIDVSYFYDVSTSQIVPGTEVFTSEGILGAFLPSTPADEFYDPGNGFVDSAGDYFDIQFDGIGNFYQPTFPQTGTYNTKWDQFLDCVTQACWQPLGGGNVWADSGSLTITPAASTPADPVSTPENGVFGMLAAGLVGIGLLKGRRKIGMTFILIAVFVFNASAKQQSHTDCTVNGNSADCNTTTYPTYNGGAAMAQAGKDMAATGAAIGQARQRAAANKQMWAGVETRVVYCQQNSNGFVTTGVGERKSCPDELAYVKAVCTVGKIKGYKPICKTAAFTWGKEPSPSK